VDESIGGGILVDVDIGMAVAFTAGVLLGGAGGVFVICILVGGNLRRGKHERVKNIVYRKKIM